MRRIAAGLLLLVLLLAGALVLRQLLQPERPAPPPGIEGRAVLWAVGDGPDGGPQARRVARLIARDRALDRLLYLGDTYVAPLRGEQGESGEGGGDDGDDGGNEDGGDGEGDGGDGDGGGDGGNDEGDGRDGHDGDDSDGNGDGGDGGGNDDGGDGDGGEGDGDGGNDGEVPDNWSTRFAAAYGRLAHLTAPVPGNHDWPDGAREGYLPYWESVYGRPMPTHYAFPAGGWEVLALNSEASTAERAAQLAWLRGELREPGNCRLAVWHRPVLTAGRHRGDGEDMLPAAEALAGRATMLIGAHDHNMQRFRPVRGVTQFVSGAGGHGLYPVDEQDPGLAFSSDTEYGALRLDLRPGRADWAFIAVDGRTLDRGTLPCRRG
jgi:hypothetical protein